MSEEAKEKVNIEIDSRMKELSNSDLTREELLHEKANQGVKLGDDAFFQYIRENKTAREMLLKPDATGRCLIQDFEVILLDNAPIHHAAADVLDELEQYVKVLFIPPYCYHLSPLDNGAFGWVVHFLQAPENARFGQRPIREGLSAAFSAMPESAARYCFHNCNYPFAQPDGSDSDSSDSV